MTRYRVVSIVARALLQGATLQACEVSAGQGLLIDWRTIRCGEPLLHDADAFDVAYLFVWLVGPLRAVRAARRFLQPNSARF